MATHFSGPIALGAKSMPKSTDVNGLAAATTLTAEASNGMHYILDGGTGFTITLPEVTQGWRCKFTIGAAFSTDFTFVAGTADSMEGCIIEAGAVQTVDARPVAHRVRPPVRPASWSRLARYCQSDPCRTS